MLLLELGNTTIKLARPLGDDTFMLERFATAEEALRRVERLEGTLVVAPVGEKHSAKVVEKLSRRAGVVVIGRSMLAAFVDGAYDTPETLGIDRVLNLLGLAHDAVVVSCGTAITIDARIGGRPVFGAIMPGFATAAEGLHKRVPVLPLVDIHAEPRVPARTSIESVTNGVILGTARAAHALAGELARVAVPHSDLPVVLTGGDAQILERLWPVEAPAPVVDEMLIFQGMTKI